MNGTCIADKNNPGGGFCDSSPPSCAEADPTACVQVPVMINSLQSFTFNISQFGDAESGIRAMRCVHSPAREWATVNCACALRLSPTDARWVQMESSYTETPKRPVKYIYFSAGS